jgi:hypothetical protein
VRLARRYRKTLPLIWPADDRSPIGADASGSIDAIGTSGGVARLGEHERAECNHDGEDRCAISGEAQRSVFHFGVPFGFEENKFILSLVDKQIDRATDGAYQIYNQQ